MRRRNILTKEGYENPIVWIRDYNPSNLLNNFINLVTLSTRRIFVIYGANESHDALVPIKLIKISNKDAHTTKKSNLFCPFLK